MVRHYVKLTYLPTGVTHINPMNSRCFSDPEAMKNRLNGIKLLFAVDLLRKESPDLSFDELCDLAKSRKMPENISHEFFDAD